MASILIYSGLLVYIINYIIGWLLFFKKISMTKITHQIFFAAIILILAAQLILIKLSIVEVTLVSGSLVCMLILPFGIKGGSYHRLISSIGLLLYIIFLLL